jgi:pilus assembly protein CpaB
MSGVLLFLSLAVAVAATLLLESHLRRVEAAAAAAGPGRPLVVATSGLERGAGVSSDDLGVRRIPAAFAPPGAVTRISDAVGRTLASDVAMGEVLTETRLAGAGGPVASMVPSGLVAFPITSSLPPGSVVPGDRVDVLATYPTRPFAETVAESAEVLTVAPSAPSGHLGAGSGSVLLLVSPDVAQRLAHARAFAEIALAIASPEGFGA